VAFKIAAGVEIATKTVAARRKLDMGTGYGRPPIVRVKVGHG
jgi:hypothetical protein